MQRRALIMLVVFVVCSLATSSNAPPTIAISAPKTSITYELPLEQRPNPESCPGGGGARTPEADASVVCCVKGRVLLGGVALADAIITLTVAGKSVTTTTRAPAKGEEPIFTLRLDQSPLSAQPDDLVVVTVRWPKSSEIVGQTSFRVQPGAQQVDVLIPR